MLLSICLEILPFLREVNWGATTDLLFFTSLDGIPSTPVNFLMLILLMIFLKSLLLFSQIEKLIFYCCYFLYLKYLDV